VALPALADELCFVIDGPIQGLNSRDGACPSPSRGGGALAGEGFADAAFTEARAATMGVRSKG
jgi:hypothetical protein